MMNHYNKSKTISKEIINLMKADTTTTSNVEEWAVTNQYAQEVIEELTDSEKLSENVKCFSCPELKAKSKAKLEKNIARSKRVRIIKRTISIAAALVFLSFMVGNFVKNEPQHQNIITEKKQTQSIKEPTLILSTGEQINLNNTQIINDNHMKITKENNSSIAYVGGVAQDKPQMNTLIVPEKRIYTVLLPDGTKVVLNANGKLTYPLAFSNESREVKLEGEAYFEVAKGNVPFIVESQGARIKVYGTKFNVNSYRMNCVKTMLFEGSVGVRSTISNSKDEYIMKENQILEIKPLSGELIVGEFNPNEYKSWINGYFYSDGDTLEDFLMSLSKWYNVEFTFVNTGIKTSPLVGFFTKDIPIEDILNTIEKVLKIKFIKNERGYMIN